jgi:hypothetical protein
MMNILSILLWVPALLLRLVLIVLGLVMVAVSLLINDEVTPKALRWFGRVEEIPGWWKGSSYWWMAIRNPTGGVRFEQPTAEKLPNPDRIVFNGQQRSATRWMRHGLKSEWWFLTRVNDETYFEFRIGWKYSGKLVKFSPTMQVRLGDI